MKCQSLFTERKSEEEKVESIIYNCDVLADESYLISKHKQKNIQIKSNVLKYDSRNILLWDHEIRGRKRLHHCTPPLLISYNYYYMYISPESPQEEAYTHY